MTLKLTFSIAFASVLVYLVLFFRFARRFKELYPEMWRCLGCPESFALRGQSTYLAVILGLERAAPLINLSEVRKDVMAIRVSLAVALAAFLVVAVMTG